MSHALAEPDGLCRVKAQSSGFTSQVDLAKRLLTSTFVVSWCPLLSPRFRRVAAPAGPTHAVSGPYAAHGIRPRLPHGAFRPRHE